LFIPLTVGGGLKSPDDVKRMLRAGADKVSLNTHAVADPELIRESARRFGSQCIVLSMDVRWNGKQYEVVTHGGRRPTGMEALEWAQRGVELGAGENIDMKQFEAQYAKYDSGVDLSGVGGDLLFLNWTAQKALYAQLLACGADCTRNKFIDVLQGYDKVPSSSACLIDFTHGDGHHGADALNFMETYTNPAGKVNWRNTKACVRP